MRTSQSIAFAFALLASVACAPRSPAKTQESATFPTIVVSKDAATTVGELFHEADSEFDAAHFDAAARIFGRILEVSASHGERARAFIGLGGAEDLGARPSAAFEAYRQALATGETTFRGPGQAERFFSRARVTAWLLRLHFYLGRDEPEEDAALEVLVRQLGRERPPPLDELAIAAFLAQRALAREDAVAVQDQLARGEFLIESLALSFQTALPLEAVPFFLVKGDALRSSAARLRFDPFPADFPAVLEERCTLLLQAQSAYSDAMRGNNAEYSARAGERIADLYQSLHQDLTGMEFPQTANTDERKALLDAATRLRYSVLLVKAEKMISHTLLMVERTGIQGPSVERVRRVQERLIAARRAEDEAILRLPYSREDLVNALDAMRTDAAAGGR